MLKGYEYVFGAGMSPIDIFTYSFIIIPDVCQDRMAGFLRIFEKENRPTNLQCLSCMLNCLLFRIFQVVKEYYAQFIH